MKIVIGYPKNWDKIKERFNLPDDKFLLTLGDTLYNPSNMEIEKSYFIHEEIHSVRQLRMGVEEYVKKYLSDPVFRFAEELLAYQFQWRHIVRYGEGPDIDQLVKEFSNPSYGFTLDSDIIKDLIQAE